MQIKRHFKHILGTRSHSFSHPHVELGRGSNLSLSQSSRERRGLRFTRTLLGHHVVRPSGNRPVGNQHYAYRYQTSLLRPDRLPLIQCPCHRNAPTESSEQWA